MLRLMPFKYTVRHVPSGQNIGDCVSRLIKISALSHSNSTAEEYVRMVAISATPRVMTTREIERPSAEDEELTKVRKCWFFSGFSPGTPVFPSPQKPTFLNSNSIRNARAFNT